MATTATDFEKAFSTANEQAGGDNPDWLRRLRRQGMDRFDALGFPTRRDEEWKYTSVRAIQGMTFLLAGAPAETDLSEYQDFLNEGYLEIVFIDGVFSERHSRLGDLPAGVRLRSVRQAIRDDDGQAKAALSHVPVEEQDALAGLNTALIQDGAFLSIDANAVCKTPIHLVYIFTGAGGEVMTFPRNHIRLGACAEAIVLESYIGRSGGDAYWTNTLTDIAVGRNAHLQYYKAQAQSLQAFHIDNTRIVQEADSRLEAFSLNTGARMARNQLSIVLDGSGIDSRLDGLYAVRGSQHVDNHTVVDHRRPQCQSSQLYKGLLNGKARAVFNGKIFVRQAAQLTNAYQLNRNLLLSPEAEADTKPQLEIYADDVRCTHGATVGRLNEDELFYLQSRCLDRAKAVTMLSHGFAEDVLGKVSHPEIRDRLRGLLSQYYLDAQGQTHGL